MFNPDLDDSTLWGLALLHVSLSVTRTARLCTAETGDEDEEDGGKRTKEHKKNNNTNAFGYMFETAMITTMQGTDELRL